MKTPNLQTKQNWFDISGNVSSLEVLKKFDFQSVSFQTLILKTCKKHLLELQKIFSTYEVSYSGKTIVLKYENPVGPSICYSYLI